MNTLDSLRRTGLYPILDVEAAARGGHDLIACAREFAACGLEVQQLRAKKLDSRAFYDLACALAEVVPQLIINDRADIALLAGAAGVHLGQHDLALDAVRPLLPPGSLIGVSTHNLAQARAALLPGLPSAHPDYWALGPVYETSTKLKPDPTLGVQQLSEIRRHCAEGVLVAIGGITLENCELVWRAGADAVAVIAALWEAARPADMARQFLLAFQHFSCHSPD